MKKTLSVVASVLLAFLLVVSCKQDYTPVGDNGFSAEQKAQIITTKSASETIMNIVETTPQAEWPAGVTGSMGSEKEDETVPFYVIIKAQSTEAYDVGTPNLKCIIDSTDKIGYLKQDGKSVYSVEELKKDGYTDSEGNFDEEKAKKELTMTVNAKLNATYKNTSTPTTYILNYDVNYTTKYNESTSKFVTTVNSGSLSIDLGDWKGAIGSNVVKDIKEFFESSN